MLNNDRRTTSTDIKIGTLGHHRRSSTTAGGAMTTYARDHMSAAGRRTPRASDRTPGAPSNRASSTRPQEVVGTRRGLLGLLGLGLALVAAAGLLGVRTWQVGAGLGSAYFPVEDIVELAA